MQLVLFVSAVLICLVLFWIQENLSTKSSGKYLADPVKHCNVYKLVGCAHVDGALCNMKTCEIITKATVTPNKIIIHQIQA